MAKKFENIFIASDLDGTYFNSKTQLVERNTEAVRYFCENGGSFTFATGRLPIFIKRSAPNARELVNFPAIMGNGTCLFDYQRGEPIEEHFVDYKLLAEVDAYIERLAGSKTGIRAAYDKGVVISNLKNETIRREYEHFHPLIEKIVCPAREWGGFKLYKANIRGSDEAIDEVYPFVKREFSSVLSISRSARSIIEIMPLGASKATMLKSVKERFFSSDAILCTVGDYDNDLEMHSIADLSVCPSNANEAVRSACKLQLCSNDEGVIGDLVEYFDREL